MELGAGRKVRPHDFKRHRASEVRILCVEDDPHGAHAQDLQDAVGAEAPQLVRLFGR